MSALPHELTMGLSPTFYSALEVLIQAHVQEVAGAHPTIDVSVDNPEHYSTREMDLALADTGPETSLSRRSGDKGSYIEDLRTQATGVLMRNGVPELTSKLTETTFAEYSSDVKEREDDHEEYSEDLRHSSQRPVKTHLGGHGLTSEITLFGNLSASVTDRAEIDEFDYDVSMFYHRKGIFQAIARSKMFGILTMIVIFCNAIYLGVESDYNTQEGDPQTWIIFDSFFSLFFLIEWLCRFLAFERKWNCFKDAWFRFDSFLVVTMTIDSFMTNIIEKNEGNSHMGGILKFMRLVRLARMVRIFHAFPELATLLKAIIAGMRAVCAALLLQLSFIYAWAIALHSLLGDEEEPDVFYYWGSVPRCMMSLIANGLMGDNIGDVMRGLSSYVEALTLFFGFVFISTITCANLLIGLLCEVIGEVAKAEKDYVAISRLKSDILVGLKQIDKDGSGMISKQEFLSLVADEKGRSVLEDLGIDLVLLVELGHMLYDTSESSSLSMKDVMLLLLENQAGRKPTLQHNVWLTGYLKWTWQKDLAGLRDELLETLSKISRSLQKQIEIL